MAEEMKKSTKIMSYVMIGLISLMIMAGVISFATSGGEEDITAPSSVAVTQSEQAQNPF